MACCIANKRQAELFELFLVTAKIADTKESREISDLKKKNKE